MGILNRAERRGKDLPPELKQALIMQSELGGGCDGGGKGALVQIEVSGTLGCNNDQTIFTKCYGKCAGFKGSQGAKAGSIAYSVELSPTLGAEAPVPQIVDISHRGDVVRECGETSPSLCARAGTGGNNVPCVYSIGNGQSAQIGLSEKARTLDCMHDQQAIMVSTVDCRNGTENPDINGTSQAKSSGGSSVNLQNVVRENRRIRRLTPLECERLQGFPDTWTDIGTWVDSKGKKHETSDAARYKALGNSIALPPWKWVLKRLCSQYERDATMASLFDGIGGFLKIWEQLNGEGSCLWASEIEPFCVAVTERRFNNG